MKTYFIVNTCILDDEPSIRDEQYKNGISKLIELTRDMIDIQIVIVENNGGKQSNIVYCFYIILPIVNVQWCKMPILFL